MFATGIFKTEYSLCHFWIRTRNECSIISDLVVHKLLDFCTRYLCEAGFSKLIIKSKNKSFSENVKNALRPAFSCINLRMIDLCKNYQVHPSHQLCLITSNKLNCFLVIIFHLTVSITWQFYYCVVTFGGCVHLQDFATDKSAS